MTSEQTGSSISTPASEQVPHLDWRTFADAKPDTPQTTIDVFDDYFSHFVQMPIEEKDGKKVFKTQNCIKCDEPLTGFMIMMGRGGFQWGIAHGEGHCAGCHWPSRAHHFIKDKDRGDLLTLRNFILQYHPDYVTSKDSLVLKNEERGSL